MICEVSNPRIGADSNKYLIAMYKALQDGWVPPDSVSAAEHALTKMATDLFPDHLVAFIRFGCGFGGNWDSGYARHTRGVENPSEYATQSKNRLAKQDFSGVEFFNTSYEDLAIPPKSVIYCDPPYWGTDGYKDTLDHSVFWAWCDTKIAEGHSVFISEYAAPAGWDCVWSAEVGSDLGRNSTSAKTRKMVVEKLFTKKNPLSLLADLV